MGSFLGMVFVVIGGFIMFSYLDLASRSISGFHLSEMIIPSLLILAGLYIMFKKD